VNEVLHFQVVEPFVADTFTTTLYPLVAREIEYGTETLPAADAVFCFRFVVVL